MSEFVSGTSSRNTDSASNLASSMTYAYDSAGRLVGAAKGDKQVVYNYPTDSAANPCVEMVVEDSAGQTPYTRTVYTYASATTTVTHKKNPAPGAADDPADETTTYTFYVDSWTNLKQYVNTVTDKFGTVTTYDISDFSGALSGLPRTVTVTDSASNLLQQTDYNYDWTGTVLSVEQMDPSAPIYGLSTENNTYYTDSTAASTVWLESHEDTYGSWTHYVRDPNNVANVLAVQTAGPEQWYEPQWTDSAGNYLITPMKTYTYYTSTDSAGGLPGQVKTETVPGLGTTTYVYADTAGYHNSPVQVTDGRGNVSHTTYDALGRVVSATDTNGRTITYTYDALGRQITTSYGNGIGTQNLYSCCTLLWSMDENGNHTYYDYDGANRVIDTYTDIPGQSSTYPLVAYTYDSFGNQQTVTTYSAVGVPRVTAYTYDAKNRVTKIVYPYRSVEGDLLGDEQFGYDALSNLIWKEDGNGAYTSTSTIPCRG